MTKKLTKVAMTTALAAAAIVPAVVATPAQAAEAEVTFAKAYYTTANGTAAFEAGKLAGVIGATSNTQITYVEGSNGEVFPMSAFSGYLAVNPTATTNEVLTALSKAGKALSADQVKALNVKEGKVEGGKVTVDADAPVADVKVESVKATNAKTLEVTFNKSLTEEQQAKATFTVKRGASNVAVTATWSEDGKSAKLASGANLLTGEHTVTVTGLTEEALTGNVTVAAVKESSLEILASVLNDETAKAKLNVELKDQYGEKIALTNNAFTVTAYNKTQASNVPVTFDATYGFVIDTNSVAADFKKDDVVTVTVIHNATGLKATKELKVDNAATLSTLSVGNIVLPTGKTILTADLKDIKAPISAKDQFGSDIKPTTADFKFISSDDTIVAPSDVTVSSDGKNINIANFKKAGNVTLTILAKASGETATLTLDVQEAPGTITSVVLAETAGTIAAGSTKTIGLDVKDNYGTAIKASDYASKLSFSSTNDAVVDNVNININAKGELSIKTKETATKGNKTTVTVLSNGKAVATYEVTAGEVPVPTTIDVASTSKHATKLAIGADTTITFNALDQYGSVAGTLGDFTTSYTVKGAADNISLLNSNDTTVKVTAKKAGTAVVLAELKNAAGVTVASKEVTIEVVKNTSDSGLKIDDIKTLAKGGSADYKEAVKVVTADGTALPSSSIISVTSSNPTAATISGNASTGFFVTGGTVDKNTNGRDIDTKATITVVYNADDKPVTLTKEVTVSAAEITATDILVTDKAQVTGKTLTKDAVEVTSTSVKDFADLGSLDLNAVIKDNFGVYQPGTSVASVSNVNSVDKVVISVTNKVGYTDVSSNDAITLTAGKLTFANFADNTLNAGADKASFRILITNGSKVQYVDVAVDGKTTAQKQAEAKVAALAKISAYADVPATNPAPTVADYKAAGVTDGDVTTANLAAVNAEVAAVAKTAADETAEVQALVTKVKEAFDTVAAYELLAVDTGANIATAVTSLLGEKEDSTAKVGALVAGDEKDALTNKIAAKDALIKTAATVDESKTTISANAINPGVGQTATATVVVKNAADVVLDTVLAGDYAATYAWTTVSATPNTTDAIVSNETAKTATVTVTANALTASPVKLKVVVSQTAGTVVVTKNVDMTVTLP